jgi:heptosyltransferase-3
MSSYNRILVIKLKQPGDVLVSTPVLQALKEAWPEAQVSYPVPRGTEDMLADHPPCWTASTCWTGARAL